MPDPRPFLLDADEDVDPGDLLRSEHGAWYRVHTSRDVRRRDPQARRRQALTVTRIPTPTVVDDDDRIHPFTRHPRRR